jgi:alkylated DNA repair dioxygenase AlkB
VLRRDCGVEFVPEFLGAAEAFALQSALVSTLSWEQRSIVLFGKAVMQPRLIAWGGDVPYRYSGQTLEPRPLSTELMSVLRVVRTRTGFGFNHILLNRYRDGRDSMGWHSDDEPELGPDPPVATLSLGVARAFHLRARKGGRNAERLSFTLTSGSLLLMSGATQRHYRHALPKVEGLDQERISLTFRRILLRAPGRQ